MDHWKQAAREGLIAGSIASLSSTAALALAGREEIGHAAAPVNAISHWFWDRRAFCEDGPSLSHTLTGYLIHHGASVFWGVLHARAWGCRREAKQLAPALAGAAAAAALAFFVDYRMTPRRLTPGFEHRLSSRSMLSVYAWFALGLAAGSIAAGRVRPRPPLQRSRRAELPPDGDSEQQGRQQPRSADCS
jgi:hypothetical protein